MAILERARPGCLKICYHEVMSGLTTAHPHSSKLKLLSSAMRELGPQQLFQYARYKLGLRSGYYKWATPSPASFAKAGLALAQVYTPPSKERLVEILGAKGIQLALQEADLAVQGQMRWFGAETAEIRLGPPEPLLHWTEYETKEIAAPQVDVKFIWEPARLGWAFCLGRGYLLSGDERYSAAFWDLLNSFLDLNPAYLGLNWVSGQEVGLRVLAMTLAWHIFRDSIHSTSDRSDHLAQAVAEHASRISLTLAYARAQNNNHLLSEAAALYTAGLVLPDHTQACRWREKGWRCFHTGLKSQVAEDGAYVQNSTNYQRLMLQLALWVRRLSLRAGHPFPVESQARLQATTSWLLALLDRTSGGVPNLGPNDGTNLFPSAALPYEDFRPVLGAAAANFLHSAGFGQGPWDETGAWLGSEGSERVDPTHHGPVLADSDPNPAPARTPHILYSPGGESWAYLRAARFESRPGHADQLHLDLWWRGLNIARDAGTYLYNSPPPWENSLTATEIHNTVIVDGLEQMQRTGRFLYLNRAQAQVLGAGYDPSGRLIRLTAQHDGYHRVGVTHQRKAAALPGDRWLIEDTLLPLPASALAGASRSACLGWLLPDWSWEMESKGRRIKLALSTPLGPVELHLSSEDAEPGKMEFQIIRAGELVFGIGDFKPTWGWFSPTYGLKKPALSIRLTRRGPLPLSFKSEWVLGDRSDQA
jgi:hypothetical protein